MLRPIAISLAVLAFAPIAPGFAQQALSSAEVLCAEPYACVEQGPLTEAEILANLRSLRPPIPVSPSPMLEQAMSPSIPASVRR